VKYLPSPTLNSLQFLKCLGGQAACDTQLPGWLGSAKQITLHTVVEHLALSTKPDPL